MVEKAGAGYGGWPGVTGIVARGGMANQARWGWVAWQVWGVTPEWLAGHGSVGGLASVPVPHGRVGRVCVRVPTHPLGGPWWRTTRPRPDLRGLTKRPADPTRQPPTRQPNPASGSAFPTGPSPAGQPSPPADSRIIPPPGDSALDGRPFGASRRAGPRPGSKSPVWGTPTLRQPERKSFPPRRAEEQPRAEKTIVVPPADPCLCWA